MKRVKYPHITLYFGNGALRDILRRIARQKTFNVSYGGCGHPRRTSRETHVLICTGCPMERLYALGPKTALRFARDLELLWRKFPKKRNGNDGLFPGDGVGETILEIKQAAARLLAERRRP